MNTLVPKNRIVKQAIDIHALKRYAKHVEKIEQKIAPQKDRPENIFRNGSQFPKSS